MTPQDSALILLRQGGDQDGRPEPHDQASREEFDIQEDWADKKMTQLDRTGTLTDPDTADPDQKRDDQEQKEDNRKQKETNVVVQEDKMIRRRAEDIHQTPQEDGSCHPQPQPSQDDREG